jgi:hypothetical protein
MASQLARWESVTRANVVGVHGIGQQQSGRLQLLDAWRPALGDGVERAVGRNGPTPELDLAYYADLYAEIAAVKGVAEVAVDHDMVEFFEEIEQEVVTEEPPAELKKGGVPAPLGRLAGWLDHKFGLGAHLLFFGDLVQVRRYQREDALATQICDRVREAIGSETRVLVSHSLGSVVAYEYLCLEAHHKVESLVTLGSPLGLRSVQDRLRTKGADGRPASPDGVKRWVNVRDVNDPVACGGALSPTWSLVADEEVDNGKEAHAAVRYLGKEPTGAAVVAALT